MHTVLIADDDKSFVDILSSKISEDEGYQVVATIFDGQSAIDQIERLRPEIIILDIVMPDTDGVLIVNHIRTRMVGYDPVVYILSGMGDSRIINTLNSMDVDFYSLKPVSLDVIMRNLETMVGRLGKVQDITLQAGQGALPQGNTMGRRIELLTMQLGMQPHRKSTRCIHDALLYCIENPNGTQLITKYLYPEIGKKRGLTSSAVERNIRHAIVSVQKDKTPTFERIFAYRGHKRITNSVFLAVVSEYLMNQS